MLTIEHKLKFNSLAGQLSPENLSCDGELSRAQVKKRYNSLMTQWRALEKEVGRSVSEDETWGWWDEIQEHRRNETSRELAAEPNHPLMAHKTPGVWHRKGANGMTAYYVQGPSLHRGENFVLYSEFSHIMYGKELLGTFNSLDAAVAEGERFLKTVNRDTFRAAKPNWNLSIIDRELERLPSERNLATICIDAEMNRLTAK